LRTVTKKIIAVRNPNYLNKYEKTWEIKQNLNNRDYFGAFIDILLVSGKNPCSLAAKL